MLDKKRRKVAGDFSVKSILFCVFDYRKFVGEMEEEIVDYSLIYFGE